MRLLNNHIVTIALLDYGEKLIPIGPSRMLSSTHFLSQIATKHP